MKCALLVLGVLGFTACASARVILDPDYVAVARLGLSEAERPGQPMIVVVPDDLPQRAVAALATFRTVIPRSRLEKRPGYAMLPGHFYVLTFEVHGTRASFAGTSGEVREPPPGLMQEGCGSGPSLMFEKRSGQWAIALHGVMVC